MLRPTHNASF